VGGGPSVKGDDVREPKWDAIEKETAFDKTLIGGKCIGRTLRPAAKSSKFEERNAELHEKKSCRTC